jgi:hypothetical protein
MGPHIPTKHVLRTAKTIGYLAYLIALIGVAGSYGTQVDLLLTHDVGAFAWVIPATIDLLAVCAAMALQLPGLDRSSRRIAGWTLTVAVIVSVTANVAGGHNMVARLAHAWPVVAYLLGELLANRVRAYAARLAAAEAVRAQPQQEAVTEVRADDARADDLPEAPTSPAVGSPESLHPAVAEFIRKHGRMPHPRHAARLMGKA